MSIPDFFFIVIFCILSAENMNVNFGQITSIEVECDSFVHLQSSFLQIEPFLALPDERVIISVSPISGDVDMYVSVGSNSSQFPDFEFCQNTPKKCLNKNRVGGVAFTKNDDVVLESWDGLNGKENFLKITFFCAEKDVLKFAVFAVVIFTESYQLKLGLNDPPIVAHNFGRENSFNYFSFYVEQDKSFFISVTPLLSRSISDVNAYLYVSSEEAKPNDNTLDYSMVYKEKRNSFNVVIAKHRDAKFRSDILWGVGVSNGGFIDSNNGNNFSYVIALGYDDEYTTMLEGIPIGCYVSRRKYRYFIYTMPVVHNGNTTLVIKIKNKDSTSDANLYVNGPHKMDNPKPSKLNGEWSSRIRGDDILYIKNAQNGRYKIGVSGYSDSYFTISILCEHDVNQVYENIYPIEMNVGKGGYKYFKLHNNNPERNVLIKVKSDKITSYLSLPYLHNPHPTLEPNKHDIVAKKDRDVLYYYFQYDYYQFAPIGDIYFSVYGLYDTSFSISVIANQTYTSTIRDGEMLQYIRIHRGSYKYFTFKTSQFCGKLTITVIPSQGDVNLYVSTVNPFPGDEMDRKVSSWSSTRYKSDTIVIYSDDPLIQGGNIFYIGVRALDLYQRSTFSLYASVNDREIEIFENEVKKGAVRAGRNMDYIFFLHQRSSLSVTLWKKNPLQNVKFYMNINKPSPSSRHYDIESYSDSERIEDAGVGYYYISVEYEGETDLYADFSLSVEINYRISHANIDMDLGIGEEGEIEQIRTYIPNKSEVVFVLITCTLIKGRIALYVLPAVNSSINVGVENKIWMDESSIYGNTLLIEGDDPNFIGNNEWTIGVETFEDSNYYFSVSVLNDYDAGTALAGTALVENIPMLVTIPPCIFTTCSKHLKYFFNVGFRLSTNPDDEVYYVSIHVISGEVGVYISQDHYDPYPFSDKTWRYKGKESAIIELFPTGNDFYLHEGMVFINIYGLSRDEETEVEITYRSASTPPYIKQNKMNVYNMDKPDTFYGSIIPMVYARKETIPTYIIIDTCSDYEILPFYANIQKRNTVVNMHPSKDSHDKSSEEYFGNSEIGVLSQILRVKEIFHPERIYISATFLEQLPTFSIFVISEEVSRPTPLSTLLSEGAYKEGWFTIKIPRGLKNVSKDDLYRYTYKIYIRSIGFQSGVIERTNMQTICALEKGADVLTTFNGNKNDGEEYYTYQFPVNKNKVYKVNVVVSNPNEHYTVFTSILIINGHHCIGDYINCQSDSTCYGISNTNNNVCSTHGECIGTDTCECEKGYTGDICEQKNIECYGIHKDDKNACSSHGICISFNHCICDEGYENDKCEKVIQKKTSPPMDGIWFSILYVVGAFLGIVFLCTIFVFFCVGFIIVLVFWKKGMLQLKGIKSPVFRRGVNPYKKMTDADEEMNEGDEEVKEIGNEKKSSKM